MVSALFFPYRQEDPMPELRITETSPDIKVTLVEDDGTERSKVFNRPGGKEVDWDGCEDRQGRRGLNQGKEVRLRLPEK